MIYRLALIVPVYNEAGNILPLVEAIRRERAENSFIYELILVDNGSTDDSARALARAKGSDGWIKILTLDANAGYGGGLSQGLSAVSHSVTHLGWIPADLQCSVRDVSLIWQKVLEQPNGLHKGRRVLRHDGAEDKLLSFGYNRWVKSALRLDVKDVNGAPKIFPRSLWRAFGMPVAKSFLFDCQLLLVAKLMGLNIYEHPVVFHRRNSGAPSWSQRQFQVYLETVRGVWSMRRYLNSDKILASH